jgi:hypothetical protein
MVNFHSACETIFLVRQTLGSLRFSEYIAAMRTVFLAVSALALSIPAAPAFAGAGGFTVVNGTGANISALSIRRFGTDNWQALAAAPAPGARSAVQFSDPDCAFDLRATLAGGASATWAGVNLCEANVVTLRRNPSGETWVDYD